MLSSDAVCYALRQRDTRVQCWLDRQTGDVHVVMPELASDDEDAGEFHPAPERAPERYLLLPSYPSAAAFEDAQLFLGLIDDATIHSELATQLKKQRAFFHFQDCLAQWPIWQARWQQHSAARMRHWAEIWLLQGGIAVSWLCSISDT